MPDFGMYWFWLEGRHFDHTALALRCHSEPAVGRSSRESLLAANVYLQDELRGAKEVIRSFRAFTRFAADILDRRVRNLSAVFL